MPGPAARIGDATVHGGVIMQGWPTVLIGGMPAARLMDFHICPMVTPAPAPIPHVGGPILGPGCPTVLIGNMPAATIGDMCMCTGPPDSIVLGAPTVLIGMAGSGSASGGGGGGAGAGGATASAATAQFDNNEAVTSEVHWVEFKFVDKAGLPVSGIPYQFTDTDNRVAEGVLRLDGRIRRDGLPAAGSCKVVLRSVSEAKWATDETEVGESVKMSATAKGFDSGAPAWIRVYRRDLQGPDALISQIGTSLQGEKIEAEWTASASEAPPGVYTAPVFFFEAGVGSHYARSGLLKLRDWIEIELLGEADEPVANAPYRIVLPSGEVRTGKLDASGRARIDDTHPGDTRVDFPGSGNSLWTDESTA